MAKSVCVEPGCPTVTDTTRCQMHTRQRDKQRGTRQQRGYGKAHQDQRAGSERNVLKGLATCWRCGLRISVLEPWDQGHCDNTKSVWHGPEHRACNRGAGPGACVHESHISPPT